MNKTVFTEFRNKLTNDLQQARRKFFEKQLKNSANNIKKVWK